jgi:[calcium/calmodulin-dependent protein kinase] kinase
LCSFFSAFELLERGEVLQVPTDTPLTEEQAWKYFRDVVMGIEYRECLSIIWTFGLFVTGFVTLRGNVQ